jgi:hypothetical protein
MNDVIQPEGRVSRSRSKHQLDQSSPLPDTTAAHPVLELPKTKNNLTHVQPLTGHTISTDGWPTNPTGTITGVHRLSSVEYTYHTTMDANVHHQLSQTQ